MNRLQPFLPKRDALRPLLALLVLVATAWGCVQWAWVGPAEAAGEQASRLADTLRAAAQPLRSALHGPPRAGYRGQLGANARSLLSRLDVAASQAGVQVTRLTPRPSEPGTVNVELLADYGQLLRFVAESEALGGAIRGLQVKRAATGDRQAVAFSLAVGGEDRTAGLPDADRVAVAAAAALHPFQPAKPGGTGGDLSARYHLTGITHIGADLMATIGGRDYVVGDTLDDMKVIGIGDTEVRLAAPGCACAIRFRQASR